MPSHYGLASGSRRRRTRIASTDGLPGRRTPPSTFTYSKEADVGKTGNLRKKKKGKKKKKSLIPGIALNTLRGMALLVPGGAAIEGAIRLTKYLKKGKKKKKKPATRRRNTKTGDGF